MEVKDPLTGLLSRTEWSHALEQEVARAEADESPPPLTVALLDIDDFKAYNDAHGHPLGDRLLAEIGDVLRLAVRPTDFAARAGGDQFALLMLGRSHTQVDALLSRVDVSLKAKRTCSVGVAHWHRSETPEQLLLRADDALYEAKRERRRRDD